MRHGTNDGAHTASFMRKSQRRLAGAVAVGAAVGAAFTGGSATAQQVSTLEAALSQAYLSNPQLLATRATLRATDENVAQALSGWRPRVNLTASIGREAIEGSALPSTTYATPIQGQATVTQNLFTGGTTEANVARAKNQVQAERARLYSTEQTVLVNSATAYFNIVQTKATLNLNIQNERVLSTQLDATQDQFQVGEVTRTDVSQAQASLAGAIADRITADGNLKSAVAAFIQQVGAAPDLDHLVEPKIPDALLAKTRDEAMQRAASDNPDVVAAQFDENSARNQIDALRGQLLPQVALVGTYSGQRPTSVTFGGKDNLRTGELALQVTMPLYEAGQTYSEVRQAKQQASSSRIQIDVTRRQAIESAAAYYDTLVASRARIESLNAQIRASTIALEGVRQEQTVGSRTIIDVLNAEQTLLNSQVSLVQSQRDSLVAAYQLLLATGGLTAKNLALQVPVYDYQRYFTLVYDKWIGTDVPDPAVDDPGAPHP